jgi:hypothetical protein
MITSGRANFYSVLVLVLSKIFVLVLVLVNEGTIIFVLVLVLVHENITGDVRPKPDVFNSLLGAFNTSFGGV